MKIKNEGIILEKTNLEFESQAVLNPATIKVGNVTHMFYRAVDKDHVSSIGYCQLKNNKVVKRLEQPILFPEFDYEKKGLEDPRITFLDGTYYLFYTTYDGQNALVAYATSSDLIHFKKQGVISPKISYDKAESIFHESEIGNKYTAFKDYIIKIEGKDVLLFEKDASLFPKKINGKFALLHRILPGIQIIYFDKFSDLSNKYWEEYIKNLNNFTILNPHFWFESYYIGGGCPPIETDEGWLIIHHAVENYPKGKIYRATAALLDLKNPMKVLGRLREPLFSPDTAWEKKGLVNNVVFPTGAVVKGRKLYIYYGAADTVIAAKSLVLSELLGKLKLNRV